MPLTTTSLKLDPDIKERVQKLAETRRRSANWLMGEAIREFLVREEAREEFNRITVERWAEYQADGKSVSAEKPMPGSPGWRPGRMPIRRNMTEAGLARGGPWRSAPAARLYRPKEPARRRPRHQHHLRQRQNTRNISQYRPPRD